jgi:hypothetical protein
METPTTYRAAIDSGTIVGAVYGIGTSEIAAEQDARTESGDTTGRYTCVPCSAAAAAYVTDAGGAPNRVLYVTRYGVSLDLAGATEEQIRRYADLLTPDERDTVPDDLGHLVGVQA